MEKVRLPMSDSSENARFSELFPGALFQIGLFLLIFTQ
jgi:hypothetical protein